MRAQQLTLQTLARQQDLQVAVGRPRVHVHAEDAALQEKCVACFSQLVADAPAALKPQLQGNLDFARLTSTTWMPRSSSKWLSPAPSTPARCSTPKR